MQLWNHYGQQMCMLVLSVSVTPDAHINYRVQCIVYVKYERVNTHSAGSSTAHDDRHIWRKFIKNQNCGKYILLMAEPNRFL